MDTRNLFPVLIFKVSRQSYLTCLLALAILLATLKDKETMKNISKLFLVLFAGLLVAQCSTYSMKSDMSKNGVIKLIVL